MSETADAGSRRHCFDERVLVRTHFCLEPEQHERLAAVAAARGTSMAAVIRDAIDFTVGGDGARARAIARRLLADAVLEPEVDREAEAALRW